IEYPHVPASASCSYPLLERQQPAFFKAELHILLVTPDAAVTGNGDGHAEFPTTSDHLVIDITRQRTERAREKHIVGQYLEGVASLRARRKVENLFDQLQFSDLQTPGLFNADIEFERPVRFGIACR